MGKISEALEKINKQKTFNEPRMEAFPDEGQKYLGDELARPVKSVERDLKGKPPKKFNIDSSMVVFHDPDAIEAELFKSLRTSILFPKDRKPPKTILVTSAIPGDGKSFVSANLAMCIANGVEEHVLLVDCDLRKPTIHKIFGINPEIGLSNFLIEEMDISEAFVKTPVNKLTLLPVGKLPKKPTELLSSKKMEDLLEELKKRYDDRYIILDSPPPSVASETNAVAKYVDGVILVIKKGKTPRGLINDLIEMVGKEKIIGIVLNYSEEHLKKYYGYGYGYAHR
ncbi:MAG: CpsD/CapB family tyrosine-protein kinase [Desulfobacterium sp.]|nr:CpsD/CapB family tyrosine-protein kinase [Desulfobacterium sp.]